MAQCGERVKALMLGDTDSDRFLEKDMMTKLWQNQSRNRYWLVDGLLLFARQGAGFRSESEQ